jgi:hypothetical protein
MVILTCFCHGFVISLTMYKNSNFWNRKLLQRCYRANFARWIRICHQKYAPATSKLRKLWTKHLYHDTFVDVTYMTITFEPNGIWTPFKQHSLALDMINDAYKYQINPTDIGTDVMSTRNFSFLLQLVH